MNSQARIETHQALQALEDLDDCARMDVGISATGPYDLLRRYIQQQDRLALSHAAGQDGEQCRAASVEDSAVNAVLTTIRRERDAWLSWNHDHPEQAAITTPDVLEMAANLIRALSRGVPEGVIPEGWTLVPKVPTQQMIDCGNDVADWGYQYSSQCPRDAGDGDAHEVYHAMLLAAPLAYAIAAQRKEG